MIGIEIGIEIETETGIGEIKEKLVVGIILQT